MKTPSWLAGITHDRKKLSMMLALCGVAMLLWGRLLLKQPTRTAIAQPLAMVEQAAEGGGSPQGAAPGSATGTGGRRVAAVVPAAMAETLDRDPFVVEEGRFARVARVEPAPLHVEAVAATKLLDDRADERERMDAVRRAARGLVLQSTVAGDPPRAVISGQVLQPGERINGLELRQVLPRQVVLESDGVEVRLEM